MKKAFCLIMAVTMVFGTMLCGCGRTSDAEVGDETKDGVIGDGNNTNGTMDFMDGNDTVGSSNGGVQTDVDDINGNFNTDYGTANNGSATNNNGSGSAGGRNFGNGNGSGSGVTEYTTVAPSNRGRGSGSNDMGQSLRSGR